MHHAPTVRRLLPLASTLLLVGVLGACGGHPPAPSAKPGSSSAASVAPGAPPSRQGAAPALDALQRRFGARLGVYAVDTGTGRTISYHADDRFAFDSTYKALAAGVLLRRDPAAGLDRVIPYRTGDLQEYSPITRSHVSTGMSVRDLMDAALRYSDNTAANLLLDRLGGPHGLQEALRAVGDTTTRVDREEPAVNTAVPGDVRDTSTPRALGTDLRTFVLGTALTADRRQLLTTWLVHNTTGGPYVRSGVPDGWTVGDKTGNGDYGSRNDIAVAWPPHGAPLVLAILSDRGRRNAASDDSLIADATEASLAALR